MASIEVHQANAKTDNNRQSIIIPAPPASAFGDDDEDYRRVKKQQNDAAAAKNRDSRSSKIDLGTNFGTATFSKAPKGFEEMLQQEVIEIERRGSAMAPEEGSQNGDGDDQSSECSTDVSTDISVERSPSSDGSGSWQTFAQTKFQVKASHSYCCAPLQQPLMPKRDRADQLASLSSWVILMRIMGDLPEPDCGEGFAVAGQTKPIVHRVRDSFRKKYSKKDVDDAYRKYTELFKDPVGCEFCQVPFLLDNKETMLEKVQYITALGIYRADLRDEIYCQVCKQLTNNPSRNSTIRGWVMLYMFTGSFLPSEKFAPVLLQILANGPVEYAQRAERLLRRTFMVGTRGQPPSWLEFQAAKNTKPILLPVILMNGQRLLIEADTATTVNEVCSQIAQRIALDDRSGYSIYITLGARIACLGHGLHRVMDAISECEQFTRSQGLRESSSTWRLYFRKEFFTPWCQPGTDVQSTDLTFQQIMRGVSVGEYKCEKDSVLVMMAAQKYYIDNSADTDATRIEGFLDKWLPKEQKETHELSYWVKNVKEEIENDFIKDKPHKISLKADIVTFAMTKWYNLFSRFYDVSKVQGPSVSWNDVIIGINCKGYNIMDQSESVKMHLSFVEITNVTKGRHTVSISTVQGEEFTATSIHTEDLFSMLTSFQQGLRNRSHYAIVVQDASHFESAIGFGVAKGDLVKLDKPYEAYLTSDVYAGTCVKNGKHGNMPRDILYILPTMEEPAHSVMGMLTVQLRKDYPGIHSTPSNNQYTEVHTLQNYAKYHFRQSSEGAVTKFLSKASLKKKEKDALWKFCKEALKKPLLRKTNMRDDLRKGSLRSFNAIQLFMGDSTSKDGGVDMTSLINTAVIDTAMRNKYLRDEIFCQVIKQLTGNPNKLSEERGWQLLWLLLTCTFPQSDMYDELELFLKSNPNNFAKRCLPKLHDIKSAGSRYTPPHQLEFDALSSRHPAVEYVVLFPDQSKQKLEVNSSTRLCDIHAKIVKKLQLRNADEYGLFFGLKDKVLSVAKWDYFFDYLSHIQSYYISSADKDAPPPLLIFMKKLWMNAVPGQDKLADIMFHFPQEMPNYLRGYHKCSMDEAVNLAAILFRTKYKDEKQPFDKIEEMLTSLMPKSILQKKKPAEWKKLLQASIAKLNYPTKEDAKVAFLKTIYKWQTFGSVFFEVKQRSTKILPKSLLIAVNHNGVGLIDAETKDILQMHSFDKVPNWAFDEYSFTLVIGGEGSNITKLYMDTSVGHNMDDLIMTYIAYIMNTQIKKKPTYAGIVVGESAC